MKKKSLAVVFTMALVLPWFKPSIAQQDITAPVVLDLTFEPKFVDTSNSDQTITLTARITDDLSGLQRAAVVVYPVTEEGGAVQMQWATFTEFGRIDGDWLDGIYQTTFIVPQYSTQGKWSIWEISSYDQAGNSRWFAGHCANDPASCIDLSNDTSFINGQWSEVYLPTLQKEKIRH